MAIDLNEAQQAIIEKMKAGYWPMFCADYFEFIHEWKNYDYSWYRLAPVLTVK